MAASAINTLFHFSFAVNDRDRARKFYGELPGCPKVRQKGSVREQMLMTCRDGCCNAVEFKGLRNITDVYAVPEREKVQA